MKIPSYVLCHNMLEMIRAVYLPLTLNITRQRDLDNHFPEVLIDTCIRPDFGKT